MAGPATLKIDIIADAAKAQQGLGKVQSSADKTTKSVSSSFKSLGKVVAGAFAGAQVLSFFKDSISAATAYQKVSNQTAAVIKSTGDASGATSEQFEKLATSISDNTGISKISIQQSENMLATFTNVRNEVGKGNDIFNQATQAVTDLSVATGKSATSSAIQLGKALNDPIKGITALSRVGVSFTATQKKQIANFVKQGDLAGAQKIILKELTTEFGGSAKAQATSGDKLKTAFENLQEEVGTYLLPVVTKFANYLTQHVIPAVSSVVGWVKQNKDTIKQLGEGIAPVLIAFAAYTAATKVAATYTAVLTAVEEANPFVRVATVVLLVATALYELANHSKTFASVLKDVWKVVSVIFKDFYDSFESFYTKGKQSFDDVENAAKSAFGGVRSAISTVGSALSSAYKTVKSVGGDIISFFTSLPTHISNLGKAMGRAGSSLINSLFTGIKSVLSKAGSFAADLGKGIVNDIIGALNTFLNLPWKLPKLTIYNPIPGESDFHIGGQTILPSIPLISSGGWGSDDNRPITVHGGDTDVHVYIGDKEIEEIAVRVFQKQARVAGNRVAAGVR